jgi:chaperonin GroES
LEVNVNVIRPLGDRVVIEPLEGEEKTPGGIILPDTAKKKPQEGKVVAVGPGRVLDDGSRAPMAVKEGQVVVYAKYGGTEVTVDGKDFMILDESQIYAIKE